ncbi:hypothetical protein [Demequina mangrovi]|uniref:SPW repeat-containing protein n=1 Tax=Demequina mangrovi TaxID=1043493 RepID=A0A1H6ZLK4_9MICO|nr:hypothetical protein [Demequina mangrovi]SEJ53024.1 hypothetical protein SAMN05421637_2166 [Demequina mangrovi]
MHLERLTLPQRISAVAIVVVALAAFLPWVSIFGLSAIGLEGDGMLTLAFAIAGGVVLAITSGLVGGERTPGRASQIALVVLASLVAVIGLFDMNGAAAMGLYLTLFGGIAWVVGAVWQLRLKQDAPAAPVEGLDEAA